MGYTTPRTWADEILVDAEDLNSEIRDNVSALYAMANPPFRNLLYNGAMQVTQRGTSVTSLTSSLVPQTADRWASSLNILGTWTQSVTADAPANTGLRNCLRMLCTTANAAPAAGAYHLLEQRLEGFDVQRIAKGTTAAQTLTLSFWVKASVTGTYIVELVDNDNTRLISKTYSVGVANTWEQKVITFPADTTGLFDNDNALSLSVGFWLGAGSDYTSGALNTTTWAARTNANRAVGGVNLASAINNEWRITGVQLEVGSVQTPYEYLPYGDELRRCQRYFERIVALDVDTNFAVGTYYTSTSWLGMMTYLYKRAQPIVSASSTAAAQFEIAANNTVYQNTAGYPTFASANATSCQVGMVTAAAVQNAGGVFRAGNTTPYIDISAEL